MKKTLLLLFIMAIGHTTIAQDLSKCKKTCTQEKLIETGAFLGVRIIDAANNMHAKVIHVVPNTAAADYNFAINDVITKIDGVPIKNFKHLIQIIRTHQPHDVVKIEYIHNNKTKKRKVELGAMHTKTITETICCDDIVQPVAKTTNGLVPTQVRFVLYPNPAVNNLQITSDLAISGNVDIKIFDVLGNEVMSKEVKDNEGNLNQNINLKNLAAGSYIVKIMNNDTEAVNKLVITK